MSYAIKYSSFNLTESFLMEQNSWQVYMSFVCLSKFCIVKNKARYWKKWRILNVVNFCNAIESLKTHVLFYIVTSYSTNFEYLMSLSLVQDIGSPYQTTHIPTLLNSVRNTWYQW